MLPQNNNLHILVLEANVTYRPWLLPPSPREWLLNVFIINFLCDTAFVYLNDTECNNIQVSETSTDANKREFTSIIG